TKVVGIGDRPERGNAEALGHGCIVDARVVQGTADMGSIDAALPAVRPALEHHLFLVIAAVVVHYVKHWQAAVSAGPQYAGRIHEVAIALGGHGHEPLLLVGKGGAGRRGRAVALAAAGRGSGEVIMLGHVPQAAMPRGTVVAGDGANRPILVADCLPELGGETAGGDRGCIPA